MFLSCVRMLYILSIYRQGFLFIKKLRTKCMFPNTWLRVHIWPVVSLQQGPYTLRVSGT